MQARIQDPLLVSWWRFYFFRPYTGASPATERRQPKKLNLLDTDIKAMCKSEHLPLQAK